MKPFAGAVTTSTLALLALQSASADVEADRPKFVPSSVEGLFVEQFTPGWETRWALSKTSKIQSGSEEEFKYDGIWAVEEPSVFPGLAGDDSLIMKSKAKQHAISSLFDKPITFDGSKPFVVQYEVKMQNGLSCGGAYVKLLNADAGKLDSEKFGDTTPYSIMFGPDRCGADSKIHFIFHHKNPKTGKYEEKQLKVPPQAKIAKVTTLYTLIVNPDQTYEILVNNDSVAKGSLLEDFLPPVNPPKEIDDPTDKKPSNWVDEAEIPDPKAKKPKDWDEDAPVMIADPTSKMPSDWLKDEPLMVPDPKAVKPEEWDDEEDGEFVPPLVPNPKCRDVSGCGEWVPNQIPNPAYKGKWSPPMIKNPAYKGEWAPRKIPNKDWFEDKQPNKFASVGGVGFELWTMDDGIAFDNIYIGNDPEQALKFARETFEVKLPVEQKREQSDIENDPEFVQGRSLDQPVWDRVVSHIRHRTNVLVDRLSKENDKVHVLLQSKDILFFYGAVVAVLLGLVGLASSLLSGGSSTAVPVTKKVDAPAPPTKTEKKEEAASTAVPTKTTVTKRMPTTESKQ